MKGQSVRGETKLSYVPLRHQSTTLLSMIQFLRSKENNWEEKLARSVRETLVGTGVNAKNIF